MGWKLREKQYCPMRTHEGNVDLIWEVGKVALRNWHWKGNVTWWHQSSQVRVSWPWQVRLFMSFWGDRQAELENIPDKDSIFSIFLPHCPSCTCNQSNIIVLWSYVNDINYRIFISAKKQRIVSFAVITELSMPTLEVLWHSMWNSSPFVEQRILSLQPLPLRKWSYAFSVCAQVQQQ